MRRLNDVVLRETNAPYGLMIMVLVSSTKGVPRLLVPATCTGMGNFTCWSIRRFDLSHKVSLEVSIHV